MKKLLVFCILLGFIACFDSNVFGQTLEITYPSAVATLPGKGDKAKKEGEVRFNWETNFRVKEVKFKAAFVRSGTDSIQNRGFGIAGEPNSIKRELKDDNVDSFETTLDYGDAPFDSNTTSLTVTIVAIEKTTNSEVIRSAKIVLDNIKEIYKLSKPIPVGESPIITWQPEPKPPTINSITVKASSTQLFLAEASAYQTENEASIQNLEPIKSQRKPFVPGENTEFEFKNLEQIRN